MHCVQIGTEWDGVEQLCCGITKKRNGVPFSVVLRCEHERDNGVASSYNVQVRSLSSINGVVTITEGGIMYSFNENFLHERRCPASFVLSIVPKLPIIFSCWAGFPRRPQK